VRNNILGSECERDGGLRASEVAEAARASCRGLLAWGASHACVRALRGGAARCRDGLRPGWRSARGKHVSTARMRPGAPSVTASSGSARPRRLRSSKNAVHSLDSSTQKSRSISASRGRGWRAFHTASCCRSARFSSAKSRCVRTAERSVPRTIHSHLTIDRPIADQPTNGKTTAADEFSGRTASSRV